MTVSEARKIRRGVVIARADKQLFERIKTMRIQDELEGKDIYLSFVELVFVRAMLHVIPFFVRGIAPPPWTLSGRSWRRIINHPGRA